MTKSVISDLTNNVYEFWWYFFLKECFDTMEWLEKVFFSLGWWALVFPNSVDEKDSRIFLLHTWYILFLQNRFIKNLKTLLLS